MNDYTLGYFILGLIVRLCDENSDCVDEYLRFISLGHSAQYAFKQINCLQVLLKRADTQLANEEKSPIQQIIAWVNSYLILYSEKSLSDEYLEAVKQGEQFFISNMPDKAVDTIRELYEGKKIGRPRTPFIYRSGVLAGFLLKRYQGDPNRATAKLREILDQPNYEQLILRLSSLKT